jgi:hypothetical protein
LSVKDFRRKYQEDVRHQNPDVEALKMYLEEDELAKAIFVVLIPTLIGMTILYILVMGPLPYDKP